MITAHLILVLLGGCALHALPAAPAYAAEPTPKLGRLFLSPDWRANLERQRQLNIRETRNLEGDSVRLDGVVVRSTGKSTVWVNNLPQTESSQVSGMVAAASRRELGRATLRTDAEPPADLKVGVTLNRATRETTGGLADGEIRIQRHAPQK
jgi:hypothetical protein